MPIAAPPGLPLTSFEPTWARSKADIAEAQRLRFRVFVGELGARLAASPEIPVLHDVDAFDDYCDHLLIRAQGGPQHGVLIATCRLLTPEGASRAGGLYTNAEFDLHPLRELLPKTVELGRLCVDAAWRNGLLVMAMWKAVGEQMMRRNFDTIIGCTSVSLADGGELASHLWLRLKSTSLAPKELRVQPRTAFVLLTCIERKSVQVPPLMKGYLRCGGRVLGPPAIDPAFNTADFPMLLHVADMPSRYARRVLPLVERSST